MSLFASNVTADIHIGKTCFGGVAGRYVMCLSEHEPTIYTHIQANRPYKKSFICHSIVGERWTNVLCNMYKPLYKTLPVHFLDITQILAFDHSGSAHQITCFTNSYSQLNTEDMPVD
jgi:hypothetical protein